MTAPRFEVELGFEDDAPGFDAHVGDAASPAAANAPPLPGGPGRTPVDTVEAALDAAELLARFRAQRARWFEGLEAETAGIEQALASEAELSARWQGLPGTDHRSRWHTDGSETSTPLRDDRNAEWQPPRWVMAPLVRRRGGSLQLRLPAALSTEALERALLANCPAAWRRDKVRVRLEIETRIYWGARSATDHAPWQPCSMRGDGVGWSETLLEIDAGKPNWKMAPEEAAAPRITRSLRPGVGLLVAVPMILYERVPAPITPIGRVVQWVMTQIDRLRGVRRDLDPTFIDRLRDDAPYWAQALGIAAPTERDWKRVRRLGAELAPASDAAARGERAACEVVLLHGGLSSARNGFEAWLADDPQSRPLWHGMPPFEALPVWRFEHDSFLGFDANIAALVQQLEQRVIGSRDRGRLVLLAHSRGGAVLRFALPELRDRWPGWDFHGLTAGSPHAGTDVFERLGRRWVGLAGAVGVVGRALRGVAGRDVLAKIKNLERGMAGDIPTGFQDLLPVNIRERAEGQPWPEQLVTWGSHWRAEVASHWSPAGWRHVIEDFAGFEADGDGMIPLESARHGPLGHDASPVFHTEYFAHPATAREMREAFERLMRP